MEPEKQSNNHHLPDGLFKLIYADCPWEYRSKKSGGSMKSGAAQKYPTMTLTEICNLPVSKIADKRDVSYSYG